MEDSISPACFIISWYKFTTASILAKDSGEVRRMGVRQGRLCSPHPPIPPLTHRQDTDQTGQPQQLTAERTEQ